MGRIRRGRLIWVGAIVLVLVVGGLMLLRAQAPAAPLRSSLAPEAIVPQDQAGYARADGSRPLSFPADDGAHPDYQTEWWYYTGNLLAVTGESFGYQLTFFRRALRPPPSVLTPDAGSAPAPGEASGRRSDWATEQVYLAHFALTDVVAGRHLAVERAGRGAAGLAGAQASPFRVWLDDWTVFQDAGGALRLQAVAEQFSVTLTLRQVKPLVLQGDAGYSRKGPEPGNASYYYSLTRLATEGSVTSAGRTYAVSGLSWMDHEFSTNALSVDLVGWDWFSIQLDDGSELMLYRLREANGAASPYSGGTLIAGDGSVRRLAADDFTVAPKGQWRSPHTGAVYPSGWSIKAPSAGLDLAVTPCVLDQENNLSYSYWEGSVRISGARAGSPVSGFGYAELTGYAGSLQGQF